MFLDYREKLTTELMALQNAFIDNVLLFKQNVKGYDNLMESVIENVDFYFSENQLQIVHQSTKEDIIQKVWKC